ncbi:MAG: HU family DNA-binding protein, partial [Candidatus Marinimicrobia bacterium]|nr:HU family DNA-binding protein [Candidatus Neomarinimicrobiota bacterium]
LVSLNDTLDKVRELRAYEFRGRNVELRNFGVFEVKPTKAKPKARNPRTNEIIHVPPRRKTHFRPGKLLKKSLRQPLDTLRG